MRIRLPCLCSNIQKGLTQKLHTGTSLDYLYLGQVRHRVIVAGVVDMWSHEQRGHLSVTIYTRSRVVCLRLKDNLAHDYFSNLDLDPMTLTYMP